MYQAATANPSYHLLLARILTEDWASHGGQEMACLHPFSVGDILTAAQWLINYTYYEGSMKLIMLGSLQR